MENQEFGRTVWLPYFHVLVEGTAKEKIKYGQYAPYLGLGLFINLVEQARQAGYLA